MGGDPHDAPNGYAIWVTRWRDVFTLLRPILGLGLHWSHPLKSALPLNLNDYLHQLSREAICPEDVMPLAFLALLSIYLQVRLVILCLLGQVQRCMTRNVETVY